MFAALLRLLAFGHKPRFADWPDPPSVLPPLDLAAGALGPLRFGAALDDIRAFGRPDRHTPIPPDTSDFLYAPLGLLVQLDEHQGLDYLAFLIAPDAHDPKHPRLRHCTPRLSTGHTLGPATTEADLRRLFGAPTHDDRDKEEIILYHLAHDLRVECELAPSGTLKRLNLYPHTED
jgi:hypothetical protein